VTVIYRGGRTLLNLSGTRLTTPPPLVLSLPARISRPPGESKVMAAVTDNKDPMAPVGALADGSFTRLGDPEVLPLAEAFGHIFPVIHIILALICTT
jgi:hypothetical protein